MSLAKLTLEIVRQALSRPLPGAPAQHLMAVKPRSTIHDWPTAEAPRQGAVLIALFEDRGELWLPLTRRSERVATHKGQISLPGGARDPEDESLWHTALREAREEISLDSGRVTQIGALSDLYISASHFVVRPFVGYVSSKPTLKANADEVAELIVTPLCLLLDDTAKRTEDWLWREMTRQVPFYLHEGHIIWGATAMMLSEFEQALRAVVSARGDESGVAGEGSL